MSIYLRLLLSIISVCSFAASHEEFKLDNGLQVIVLPDHRSPVVTVQVWYKVGSSYEFNGITGVSHALEHMMFRGTNKEPYYSRQIAALGGTDNAFTSYDYTAYYQVVPVSSLEQVLALEADRMENLKLDQALFVKEMAAILEERRMRVDDSMLGLALERFYAAAFLSNPYHHPVIGWENDIINYKLADLKSWYDKWYTPNNAVIVVVGDVTKLEVAKLVKQYFTKINSNKIEPPKPRVSQVAKLTKTLTMELPVNSDYLLIGFKVPSITKLINNKQQEFYALDVLSSVLAMESSGLLVEKLVNQANILANVSVSYNGFGLHDNLFLIKAQLQPGVKLDTVISSINKILSQVKLQAVDLERLNRIKQVTIADNIYSKDSINHRAIELGITAALGLPLTVLDNYVANIKAVTADQVNLVANKYLVHPVIMRVIAKGTRRGS